jgi:hypothetical protein
MIERNEIAIESAKGDFEPRQDSPMEDLPTIDRRDKDESRTRSGMTERFHLMKMCLCTSSMAASSGNQSADKDRWHGVRLLLRMGSRRFHSPEWIGSHTIGSPNKTEQNAHGSGKGKYHWQIVNVWIIRLRFWTADLHLFLLRAGRNSFNGYATSAPRPLGQLDGN